MEYQNEHQRHMAILEAAMPYIAPKNRHAIELFLQADTFAQLVQKGSGHDLKAAESDTHTDFQPNPQDMLVTIGQFLTPKESDIVQTILNFINAQKLFQNYSDFVHTQSATASSDLSASAVPNNNANAGNPFSLIFQLINGLGSLGRSLGAINESRDSSQQNIMKDFLLSQLNPEQKATFEQFQNIMYNENKEHYESI